MVVGIGVLDDPCADLIAFGNVILVSKITGRVTDPPLQYECMRKIPPPGSGGGSRLDACFEDAEGQGHQTQGNQQRHAAGKDQAQRQQRQCDDEQGRGDDFH